jgi:RHS repeat-associated protein
MDVSWDDAVSAADHYGWLLYARISPSATYEALTSEPMFGTSFTHTGLTNAVHHRYLVVEVDTAGNLSPDDPSDPNAAFDPNGIALGIPVDNEPPGPPTGLIGDAHSSSVDVWWDPAPEQDIATYVVAMSNGPMDPNDCADIYFYASQCCGLNIEEVTPPLTKATHSEAFDVATGQSGPLLPTTNYYYLVCAKDDDGNISQGSEVLTVRTKAVFPVSISLSDVEYGNCGKGFWYYPYDDVAFCTIPGNLHPPSDSPPTDWVETSFSHVNYRRVKVNWGYPSIWDPNADEMGVQLYRRRSSAYPWEAIAGGAQNLVQWFGGDGSRYPISSLPDSSGNGYVYFDLRAEDFCTESFEFTLAPRQIWNDPNTEEDMSGIVSVSPVLPAPENLRAIGAGAMNASNLNEGKYLFLSWDSYKGACRADYKGIRMTRIRTDQGLPASGAGYIEITRDPSVAAGFLLGPEDMPHACTQGGDCTVPLTTRFGISAWAETDDGTLSGVSNGLCVAPGVDYGTNNGDKGSNRDDNVECLAFSTPGGYLDPNSPYDKATDPNSSLTLEYPWGGSWDIVGIHGLVNWSFGGETKDNISKVKIFRTEMINGQPVSSYVKSLPGDERFFALAGWTPRESTLGVDDPNPLEECNPDVSYRAAWVDLGGRVSPLSEPVTMPSPGQLTSPPVSETDPNDAYVHFSWGPALGCGGGLQGYRIYRKILPADPNDYENDCASFTTSSPVLIENLTTDTEFEDSPPFGSSTMFWYKIVRVGTAADEDEEIDSAVICLAKDGTQVASILHHDQAPPTEQDWEYASHRMPEDEAATSFWEKAVLSLASTARESSSNEECAQDSPVQTFRTLNRSGKEVLPGWVKMFGSGGVFSQVELRMGEESESGNRERKPCRPASTETRRPDLVAAATAPSRVIGQSGPAVEVIYFHTDHLGSPVAITNESALVVARHKFLPFGEEMTPFVGVDGQPKRFTGHERDSESGLDYMLARYYGAGLGRFLAVDPSASSVDPTSPQTFNRYTYARNNPLNRIDPDGATDIYIGGAADHRTQIVKGYVQRNGSTPGRTVAYFTHDQVKEATAFANENHGNGEPMNIIGHSWGADSAIQVAAGVNGTVDNLVGVDPVGKPLRPGGDSRPDNVANVVSVTATPSDRDSSDLVEAAGVLVGGRPDAFEKGANTSINVDANHADFSKQYNAKGQHGRSARDTVDESYRHD